MDNCLIINGKIINLSDETVKELTEKLNIPDAIKEMEDILSAARHVLYDNDTIIVENNIMHISVPESNTDWYFGVVDAVKTFCSRGSCRWPSGGNHSRAGCISVRFETN